VVTALHLALVPLADVYAGALLFPAEVGAAGVRAYRDWAAGVSDDVTSIIRFLRPPDIPTSPSSCAAKRCWRSTPPASATRRAARRRSLRCARSASRSSAMEPWAADGGYFNFAERPCDTDAILPPDVCARLSEVKRKWDPDGRVFGNHAVSLDPAA
jgi:hypothetical protein